MVILKESRVGVDVYTEAFPQNQFRLWQVQPSMQSRAFRPLHAVVRPQRLLSIGRCDAIVGLAAIVCTGKRNVPRRVPVLRKQNVPKPRSDLLNHRNHFIAVRNCKRAARTKVILYINDEQDIRVTNLHLESFQLGLPNRSWRTGLANTYDARANYLKV